MKVFVPPLKWDAATDGPDALASHQWLQEFECSQLPPDTVFPKPGQVWQALRDCVVGVVATMELKDSHPVKKYDLTDGETVTLFATEGISPPFPIGRVRLMKGENVRIVERNDFTEISCSRPLRVNFRTLRHKELGKDIIPQALRDRPEYKGYSLQIATARPKVGLSPEDTYLNEDFERVEDLV